MRYGMNEGFRVIQQILAQQLRSQLLVLSSAVNH
jgi:hypothetical protein